VVAGPCPADVGWAYDGVSGDPCDAIYIKYVALPDVCKTCDDALETPPAAPTLGAPSDCCDDDVCIYFWQANRNCPSNAWLTSTSSGGVCASPGTIGGPKNVWFVAPGADCPSYTQTTLVACDDDCAVTPPGPPTPAVPPNPPSFYAGCCPLVCFARFSVPANCASDAWGAVAFDGWFCAFTGTYPAAWLMYPNETLDGCPYYYSETLSSCDTSADCFSVPEPPLPAPPTNPPSFYRCCDTCYYCYTAVYDCDSEVWTVTRISILCTPSYATVDPCFNLGVIDEWVSSRDDPCIYYRTEKGGLCDPIIFCPSRDDPPPPFGGAKPALCCCTATSVLGTYSGSCFPFTSPCDMDFDITGITAILRCDAGVGFAVQWNGTAWTAFSAPCGPHVVLSGFLECTGNVLTMGVSLYDEGCDCTWQITVP